MAVKLGSQAVTLYLGAVEVASPGGAFLDGLQVFPAGPTVPGAPTITFATYSDGEGLTNIQFSAPESDGGSAITSYVFYVDDVAEEPDSVTGTNAQYYADKTGVVLEVAAVNAIGEGPKSDPVTVTAL